MVCFGQVVVGPPGSGKTTYCYGMKMFIEGLGRTCCVVNLDFANDNAKYDAAIDVRNFISLEQVMEEHRLGPNGGLVYCMELLLENFEWLADKLTALDAIYVLFDFPGQVELYTHHTCVQRLLDELTKLDYRLCSVHLVDSFYCCEPATFISAVLLVAASMLRLALPHVSVLSKVDLLSMYGPLPFSLDFFTDITDLHRLLRYLDAPVNIDGHYKDENTDENEEYEHKEAVGQPAPAPTTVTSPPLRGKYRKMSEAICDVVSDLGLVSFLPLNIQDSQTVGRVLAAVDRANGFSFASVATADYVASRGDDRATFGSSSASSSANSSLSYLFSLAAQDLEPTYCRSLEIQEKYEMGGTR